MGGLGRSDLGLKFQYEFNTFPLPDGVILPVDYFVKSTDDEIVVPSTIVAGTHILNLMGQRPGEPPVFDGQHLWVTDTFGKLGASTVVRVVGFSGGVGAKITAGGSPPTDFVDLSVTGATIVFVYSAYTGFWSVHDLSAKLMPPSSAPVANLAALALVDGSGLPDSTEINVNTLEQPFILDKTSVLVPDGITIIAALGGGRWLRELEPAPRWTNQTTWFQDETLGNNENSGAVGFPVKDVVEIMRRIRVANASTTYTVNSLGISAGKFYEWNPDIATPIGNGAATLLLLGTAVDGVVSSFSVTTPSIPTGLQSATSQGTVTDATHTWIVGETLTLTSAPIGAQAVVLKDLTGGVARVSEWYTVAGAPAFGPGLSPVAGTTYVSRTLPTMASAPGIGGMAPRLQVTCQNFLVTASATLAGNQNFTSCHMTAGISVINAPGNFSMNFNNCSCHLGATTIAAASNGLVLPQAVINVGSTAGFPASGTISVQTSAGIQTVTYAALTATSFTGCLGGLGTMSTGGAVFTMATSTATIPLFVNHAAPNVISWNGGAFINASVSVLLSGVVAFFGSTFQGGQFRTVNTVQPGGGGGFVRLTGMNDTPAGGPAVLVEHNGYFSIFSGGLPGPTGLFGFNPLATFGVQVTTGATWIMPTGVTPTITGIAEIDLDSQAGTAVPVVAGVPTGPAVPLAMWAQLIGPPFSRTVMSYKSGARFVAF